MKIAMDLDGTVANWLAAFCKQHNLVFGTKLRVSDVTMWDFLHLTSFTNWVEALDWAVEQRTYLRAAAYPHAVSALRELHGDGHTILYLTHRPWGAKEQTLTWLNRRGLMPANTALIHSNDKTTWGGIDLWVDDAPHIVGRLRERGQQVLLFDRPWNQHVQEGPLVRRVYDWLQVPTLVALTEGQGPAPTELIA
jgi:uncharacterized HAD superfamily protein